MGTPLSRLAGLGIAAVLMVVLMWLFAWNQVADTSASAAASNIEASLERSLAPGRKPKVTMTREGPGKSAPRRYDVRLAPSDAVAADPRAVDRLCERAADLVMESLGESEGDVAIVCTPETAAGPASERRFARVSVGGGWALRPVAAAAPPAAATSSAAPGAAPRSPR